MCCEPTRLLCPDCKEPQAGGSSVYQNAEQERVSCNCLPQPFRKGCLLLTRLPWRLSDCLQVSGKIDLTRKAWVRHSETTALEENFAS